MLKYRTDIDGLRAIAVLAVLGFHFSEKYLPGGYTGVDIFFVISGFLITRILWQELESNSFSLSTFYAKRVRRLFPALLGVLFGASLIEYFYGLPNEVYTFGWSAISSAFYVSNHYFLSISHYFDSGLELNPLLHTWSLAVEEQFYIFFPLLLLGLFRVFRKKAVVCFVLLIVLSFGLSEFLLRVDASMSFYIAPARFWEFLVGGLIAFIPTSQQAPRWLMESGGWIGMALILASCIWFTNLTPFPGLFALVPVLGTALIIFTGQTQGLTLSAILSHKSMRWIGKISYSLYLWHWPIIVFYKAHINPEPTGVQKLLLIGSSFLIAYLSWRFIEEKTRTISIKKRQKMVIGQGVVASLLVAMVGTTFVVTEGGKYKFNEAQLGYLEYLQYETDGHFRTGTCFLTSDSNDVTFFDENACIPFSAVQQNVLVIGDSHAAQYFHALSQAFPQAQFSQITASGCLPLLEPQGERRCSDLMSLAYKEIVPQYNFDAIILIGRWPLREIDEIKQTADYLSSLTSNLIVLGPNIEYTQSLPKLMVRFDNKRERIKQANYYDEVMVIDRDLRKALEPTSIKYYSVLDIMCPERSCKLFTEDGGLVQFDESHLTLSGAKEIVQELINMGLLAEFQMRSAKETQHAIGPIVQISQ